MDHPPSLHSLPVGPDTPNPAVWAAVGHYLADRGAHVPLAALLRTPWRCLIGLAAGARPAAGEGGVIRPLPSLKAAKNPPLEQND